MNKFTKKLSDIKELEDFVAGLKNISDEDYIGNLIHSLKVDKVINKVFEEFNFKLNGCYYLSGNVHIGDGSSYTPESLVYMDGVDRYISWSDDSRQPDGEWLFKLSFPTGAYVFGKHYPKNLFNKFFNELKSKFEPKYSDTANSALYFSPDNAKAAFEGYKGVIEKYRSMVDEDKRLSRLEELKLEISKLEEEINE